MVDGGVLPLCTRNARWSTTTETSFRGIIFIYHRGRGWGLKEFGGGDLLILRGNGGGEIGRSQQSVKGGIWKLYCQLTAKRDGGDGRGGHRYILEPYRRLKKMFS